MTHETTKTEADPATGESSDAAARPVIRAEGVTKEFGDDEVFESIDLTVREGEILLLMGPNGVGKTIFICCLAGALNEFDGDVSVFGRDPDEVSDRLSLLLQGSLAKDPLTGSENLEFYSRLHTASTAEYHQLANRLGLDGELEKVVKHYSGGMKRKLELAMTLGTDVPLYLLDEPTNELDLSAVNQFHDLLLTENDAGKTFVVASHNPLDAQIADRIVFVNENGVVASDSPADLLASLPKVVRVRGAIGSDIDELVAGGRTFRKGDEFRAFLDPDQDLDAVERAIDEDERARDFLVEYDDPSYVDMFNYFSHVRPDA